MLNWNATVIVRSERNRVREEVYGVCVRENDRPNRKKDRNKKSWKIYCSVFVHTFQQLILQLDLSPETPIWFPFHLHGARITIKLISTFLLLTHTKKQLDFYVVVGASVAQWNDAGFLLGYGWVLVLREGCKI